MHRDLLLKHGNQMIRWLRYMLLASAVVLGLNAKLWELNLDEIDLDKGLAIALDALHNDRLALLCGAGLSMPSPSNLPNAAQLARNAKRKYDAQYGTSRPPLPAGIEEQAEFFFQN